MVILTIFLWREYWGFLFFFINALVLGNMYVQNLEDIYDRDNHRGNGFLLQTDIFWSCDLEI